MTSSNKIVCPGGHLIGWPSTSVEFSPGLVGLDYAIGRRVIVRDWYGAIEGRLDGWSATSPTAVSIALTLPDGRHIPAFSLSATREIEVLS